MPVAEDILLGSSRETVTSEGAILLELLALSCCFGFFNATTSLFKLGTDVSLSLVISRNRPSTVDN